MDEYKKVFLLYSVGIHEHRAGGGLRLSASHRLKLVTLLKLAQTESWSPYSDSLSAGQHICRGD